MNWANGIRMMHNVMLLCKAENMINSLIDNGMSIYLKNPDGTQIRSRQGMQLMSLQVVEEEEQE